jgi:hypothetical protein
MSPARRRKLRAVNSLDSFIGHLSAEQLLCRDIGHNWRPFTAAWLPEQRCYESTLKCTRCKTQRRREIGRNGERLSNRYEYEDGYTAKGVGRLNESDRDRIRLASILSLVPTEAVREGRS